MTAGRSRKRDWLPEAAFIALVIGGSLAWVLVRFWPW